MLQKCSTILNTTLAPHSGGNTEPFVTSGYSVVYLQTTDLSFQGLFMDNSIVQSCIQRIVSLISLKIIIHINIAFFIHGIQAKFKDFSRRKLILFFISKDLSRPCANHGKPLLAYLKSKFTF